MGRTVIAVPRCDGSLWVVPSLEPLVCCAWSHRPAIPAEFVKPFRLGGKNDAADAEAIAVAARQPTMRFVAIKSVEQQAILAWHSIRSGWQEQRTALLNRTRGLLAEFGW
ncbi:IS110 family transposase [Paraburkholderia sp. 40]|uniref:IS110 family transposase n=1 Tax=Paraburkholderia sp. 40 TaxID=2991059 RepID=UPI003D21A30F